MTRRRKLGLAAAAIAIGAVLFLNSGNTWLAQRAFDRALDTSVGVDQSAALGDGLHAYVCGSGSPMPDATRAGPCIGVLAGNQAFVFDAGSGSIRKLMRMGFPMEKIQAGFLTHLHSDHIDGLGELLLQAWIGGSRGVPLPVYGPEGTDKVIAAESALYEIDKGFRIAHHGEAVARPGGFGGTAQVIALPEGADAQVAYDRDGVRITVIRVVHDPVKPAFGYRVDYKGRSITISGDTAYSPVLARAARGSDLLLHEALNRKMVAALGAQLEKRGRSDAARIMHDIQGYHASPEEAARTAREAGVRALVLYHLVPAPPAKLIEPLFLGDAPKEFSGTLRLAQDGMMISLPAGGQDVKISNVF
ncbi:MAG TPA: MBL fold metallo-hydrolase [Novosphingobium sp.]|jgi:ribonuclease Z|nr:MBL fold metallo-hydrolase [Novosphingobium sp.]